MKSGKREALLRLHFRRDKQNRKTLDAFADQLRHEWDDIFDREQLAVAAKVFVDEATNSITMDYDFLPEHPQLEPGAKRVGTIVHKRDGRTIVYLQNKRYADCMEQAREKFRETIKRLNEFQRQMVKS